MIDEILVDRYSVFGIMRRSCSGAASPTGTGQYGIAKRYPGEAVGMGFAAGEDHREF